VETGNRSSKKVEILSGIQIGDSVVVSGMLFVRPGSAVKVRRTMTVIP
jgi:membrane fusion protein (multidrug efflux system)